MRSSKCKGASCGSGSRRVYSKKTNVLLLLLLLVLLLLLSTGNVTLFMGRL